METDDFPSEVAALETVSATVAPSPRQEEEAHANLSNTIIGLNRVNQISLQ